MKRRFEKTGLIKTTRIVDLQKLGYQIYALAHVKFGPQAPLKVRSEGIHKTDQLAPQFLNLSGNSETVLCAAFANYDGFFATKKALLAFYSYREFILGEPSIELVALGDMDIPVNCDFSSLVGEALESLSK